MVRAKEFAPHSFLLGKASQLAPFVPVASLSQYVSPLAFWLPSFRPIWVTPAWSVECLKRLPGLVLVFWSWSRSLLEATFFFHDMGSQKVSLPAAKARAPPRTRRAVGKNGERALNIFMRYPKASREPNY